MKNIKISDYINSSKKEPYLTVGELKSLIEDMDDKTPVVYERIVDWYFEQENNGWFLIKTPDCFYPKDQEMDNSFIEASTAYTNKDKSIVFITAHI